MKRNDDEGKALEAVIKPLIDAMAPKTIEEPKTKIGKLIRMLIKEHLADAMYTTIIDRFIIDSAEKDPKGTYDKLVKLNVALSNLVFEIEEEDRQNYAKEEGLNETLQKA